MYCQKCKNDGFESEMLLYGDVTYHDVGLKHTLSGRAILDPDSVEFDQIYISGDIKPRYYECIECDNIEILKVEIKGE